MIALINSPFLINSSYELTLSIFPTKVRAKMKAALLFEARDALLFESLHRVAELPCAADPKPKPHPHPHPHPHPPVSYTHLTLPTKA